MEIECQSCFEDVDLDQLKYCKNCDSPVCKRCKENGHDLCAHCSDKRDGIAQTDKG